MKVDLSCPIELWAYELPTKENQTCSFTFFNLGELTISSIQVTVTCFDDSDQVLSRRIERPMALNAKGRETFSIALSTEGMAVESVDLIIDKAWLEDGSEWRRAQEARLTEYRPNELPPNRKLEQLRYIAGNDAVGYPSDQRHVWICVCGRVNAAEDRLCKRCRRDKKDVFTRFSPESIQMSIDKREKELEEKARQAREEASRQEFLRQEKVRRKKRNRRVRTGVACVMLVVGAASYLFVVLGLPELRYQSAKAALASGDYRGARSAFVDLAEYRDTQNLIKECDLLAAKVDAASGSEDRVDDAIEFLSSMGDFPGVSDAMTEAIYQKAKLQMAKALYADASELFLGINGYQDADALRQKAEYEAGKAEMNSGLYDAAQIRFEGLGLYQDAAALAKECVYRPATKQMADGNYDKAAEMFALITGYRDTNALRLESLYQSALMAQREGDYDRAAESFMQLGTYEDASEQVKETIYLAAKAAQEAGEYDRAIGLYATFPSYKDSVDQQKACRYVPAQALMAEKKYDEAAALFKEVPGYQDADKLYQQCLYTPAKDAIEMKEFGKAVELLEQILDYEDAKTQLQIAQYGMAEQAEEKSNFEEAALIFEALGDYKDAGDRLLAVRYALAKKTFDDGLYSMASDLFAELGKYKDSQEQVLWCEYELVLLKLPRENMAENENLQSAYDELMTIEELEPAKEKAKEIAYAIGVQRIANDDLVSAVDAFVLAGDYNDADERRQECIYNQAQEFILEGDFQDAAKLFDSIAGYSDARVRRDEAYDSWLKSKASAATEKFEAEDYVETVAALQDLDMNSLPRAYAQLKETYLEANIRQARKLIAEDSALAAYQYLNNCRGYKNADELLNKNIYRILGTWETEMGAVYAFYFDGSCVIDGEDMRFNMFNAYGISVGETDDTLKRRFSFANGTEDSLTLREDASGKSIRMTRVREAEEHKTENAFEGRPVVESVIKAGEGMEEDQTQPEALGPTDMPDGADASPSPTAAD